MNRFTPRITRKPDPDFVFAALFIVVATFLSSALGALMIAIMRSY